MSARPKSKRGASRKNPWPFYARRMLSLLIGSVSILLVGK
jgi:hypothetical protein